MKKSAIILCLLIFVTASISFFILPDQIPMHYNLAGEVNRYGNRMEIFFLPFASLALSAILILIKKIDPKKDNIQQFQTAFYVILFIVNLFIFVILLMIILEARYPKSLNISMMLWICTCMLLIITGNVMPKFKSNYFIGIRSPWTLANEQVWFKTHRFAGKIWFYGGTLMLFGIFIPSNIAFYVLMTCTLFLGFVPYIYSYRCFKEIEHNQEKKERNNV